MTPDQRAIAIALMFLVGAFAIGLGIWLIRSSDLPDTIATLLITVGILLAGGGLVGIIATAVREAVS